MSNNRRRIGFVTKHKDYSSGTTLGSIVVDYLIETRSEPAVNVVMMFGDGNLLSVYSPAHYLGLPLKEQQLGDFILNRSTFVSLEDEEYSLKSLRNYLKSLGNDLTPEEKSLLNKTTAALNSLKSELITVETYPGIEYEEVFEEGFEEDEEYEMMPPITPMPRSPPVTVQSVKTTRSIARSPPRVRTVETVRSPPQVKVRRTVNSRTPVFSR